MATIKLAFDRGSVRSIDADGRLHVAKTHISKAAVNPYYGREIPKFEELGLDPDKIYRLLRDPVELERAAETFARLPVQIEHVHTTAAEPRPELVVGALGSDVSFTLPYLDSDMSVWDAKAIAGIETGDMQELSCAYRYVAVMESGEYEGEPYDGRMTEIKGSHVCLVPNGRAGSDVLVADNNPFARQTEMKKIKFNKARVKAQLIAKDASLDSNKLDSVLDAILDVEQEPSAAQSPTQANDEDPSEKIKEMLKGKVDESVIEAICAMCAKPAKDEAPESPECGEPKPDAAMDKEEKDGEKPMKKEEVKAAMDAAIKKSNDELRKQLQDAAQARADVRATVGDVSVAMDSAAAVYGFALDQLKIDRTGVSEVPALRALYKVATSRVESAPKIATDAAGLETMFPAATRFSHA